MAILSASKLNTGNAKSILKYAGMNKTTAGIAAKQIAANRAISEGTAATGAFSKAFSKLGLIIKSHPLLSIAGALVGVIAIVSSVSESLEEAQQKAEKSREKYATLAAEIQSLNSQLDNTKQRIDELMGKDSLNLVEQNELTNLLAANQYLEKQIELKEQLAATSQKKATEDTLNALGKESETNVVSTDLNNNTKLFTKDDKTRLNRLDAVQTRLDAIRSNEQDLQQLTDRFNAMTEADPEYYDVQADIALKKSQIESWEKYYSDTMASLGEELGSFIDEQGNSIDPTNTELTQFIEQYQYLIDQILAMSPKASNNPQKSLEGIFSKTKFQDVSNSIQDAMRNGEDFNEVFEKFADDPILKFDLQSQNISPTEVKKYFENLINPAASTLQEFRRILQDSLILPSMDDSSTLSIMSWIDGLSDEDVQIAYQIVSSTDTSTWSMEDFALKIEELKKEKLSLQFDLTADFTKISSFMDQLNAAMAKSVTGTGLSTENITAIQNMYKDLDGYDASVLFEQTANGIHLNAEALRLLNSQYESSNKDKFFKNATAARDAWLNAQDNSSFTDEEKDQLKAAYDNAAMLAAQYEGLTSAYQQWVSAQSAGEEGDMYDSFQTAIDRGEELKKKGLIGTEEFRAIADLFSYEDLSTASPEEVLEAYNNAAESIKRIFSGNDDHSGIELFKEDLQAYQEEGDSFIKELGDKKLVLGDGGKEELAKKMGVDVEAIEAVLRKLKDYGWDIQIEDSSIENYQKKLDEMKQQAEDAREKLNKLKEDSEISSDIDFNADIFSMNEEQVERYKEGLEDLREAMAEKYGADSEEVKQVDLLLEECVTHKRELEQSSSISVSYDQLKQGYDTIIEFQNELSYLNSLSANPTVHADGITASKERLTELAIQLSQLSPEVLISMGITGTTPEEIATQLMTGTVNIPVEFQPLKGEDTKTVTVSVDVLGKENLDNIKNIYDGLHNKTVTVTLEHKTVYTNSFLNFPIHFANGTAHSNGTIPTLSSRALALGGLTGLPSFSSAAYARGDWGTKRSENALTGELGKELIVYGNRWWTVGDTGAEITHIPKGAIVFNHKQTEEILKNGYVTSGGGRGKAYASGTISSAAYASGTASDAEDSFEELVDWIVRKLDVLKARTEQFLNAVESAVSVAAKKANFDAAFQNMTEHMRILTEAAARYQQQADSSGLSDEYKELVRSGRIDLETITDEDLKETIDTFQDFYDKAQDCSDELVELRDDIRNAAEDFANLRLEEAEEKIDRLDDAMSRLESAYKHALSLTEKNNLLDQQTQNLKNQLDIYNNTLVDANTQLAIQIGLLKNATGDQFLSAFEAKEKIDTSSLSGDTLILAEKYNALLSSSKEAYQKASEAADDYTDAIRENAKAKLENLQTDLENQNGLLDSKRSRYETQLDLLEARGDSIGSAYYQRMQEISKQERSSLEAANRELQTLLDKEVAQGTIVKGSEDWYDLTEQILDNANAIDGCTKNILEMQQAMDEIKWDHLERKLDAFQNLTDETDFLLGLLERQDLVDQSTGAYTEAGIASAGLMAQKLAIARQSMKEYQKALEDLDAAAAKSGANQMGNSGYNAYMEKRNELMGDYRDAISDAYSYEDEMMDLIQDKLDAEADAYEEILDKRKEALKTAKEEAEYQKNIAEQTGNIQELERQLAALEGNDSDYAKKRRKQLKADLADAEEKLADTEADKKYEIQVDVLDQDFEDFKTSLDEYAKDTKTALGDLTSEINSNVSTVQSSLETLAGETGYQISTVITDVWATAGNAVTSYSGTVADAGASVTARLEEISNAYDEMAARVAQATESMLHSIDKQNEAVTKQNNGTIQSGQVNNGTNSDEVSAAVDKDKNYILGLYRDLLGREADAGGLASWLAAMASGMSAEEVRQGFLNSEEYRRMHGESGASGSANAVVTAKSGVNIRSSQSSSNSRNLLGALPNGTEVEVLEDDGHWLKIRGGGLTGWAVSKWFRRYAAGTRRAGASSWAWTSDGNGDEIVISPNRRAVLTPVAAGDIIPNADLSRNLFAWGAYRPEDFIQGIGLPGHALPAVSPVTNITIPIEAPLVRVDGIATDEVAARMTKQIDQQLKNFGRDMKKSIQTYTVRR